MNAASTHSLMLPDPAATTAFGTALAGLLHAGDTVLLAGPIGAGKSHMARAVIRALLDDAAGREEIPSPTYTLVQSYDTARGPLLHADLYRLTDPRDLDDIGLTDAFGQAICLVEWPEILGDEAPQDALVLTLSATPDDGRQMTLQAAGNWGDRLPALLAAAGATA